MIPPSSPPSDPRQPDLGLERPRPDARRVLWIGFSLSAVLHLVAIVLYAVFTTGPGRPLPAPDAATAPPAPRGTEVVRLVEVPDDAAAPEDEEEEPRPEVEPPEPERRAPQEAEPAGRRRGEEREEPARTPTAAELLRPRAEGDERIWRPIERALLELSPTEVAELRAAGRLQDWADSVAAVREAERRALDWTHTDDEGRRWGISPEGIHLGDITLPAPSFGTKHAESARRQYEWNEIERGAADARVRYLQDDRARAIRERRDREREQAKADTTGGGGR